MLTALSTALSALTAETTAVDVTGNNLANLNTTGYKSSSLVFDDLFSQSLTASGTTQVGLGVQNPTTERVFSQGAIQASASGTDVAIQGNGFLIVKTASGQTEYTRAGNLQVSAKRQFANRQRRCSPRLGSCRQYADDERRANQYLRSHRIAESRIRHNAVKRDGESRSIIEGGQCPRCYKRELFNVRSGIRFSRPVS